MKEIFGGQNYDLFLSDDEYVIKDKKGRSVFRSSRWVSNYRKMKESVEKLSELGEQNGRKDLIANQINSTLDLYSEDNALSSSEIEKTSLSDEKTNSERFYDVKIKRKLSTSELHDLSRDMMESNVSAISESLYKKMRRLLLESFSPDHAEKILGIFKQSLFKGLFYITDNLSPVAIVDRNPHLKELCQKILQSYSEDNLPLSSVFEKNVNIHRTDFTSSSYAPYKITTDGEKFFLEKKTGSSWRVMKKSDHANDLVRVLNDIENKERDRQEKKDRDREEKRSIRQTKKEESLEKKKTKKRSKSWSRY